MGAAVDGPARSVERPVASDRQPVARLVADPSHERPATGRATGRSIGRGVARSVEEAALVMGAAVDGPARSVERPVASDRPDRDRSRDRSPVAREMGPRPVARSVVDYERCHKHLTTNIDSYRSLTCQIKRL
uniref:Uncharacterized protein n=1 Tax=Haemonchus contortus TaxID=6289 RepID=U6PS48_HAECO|nr:unnamed protein product [Haemonchus contortus]CDJ95641.1 unnamed protein product [Haemonchus contortus]